MHFVQVHCTTAVLILLNIISSSLVYNIQNCRVFLISFILFMSTVIIIIYCKDKQIDETTKQADVRRFSERNNLLLTVQSTKAMFVYNTV